MVVRPTPKSIPPATKKMFIELSTITKYAEVSTQSSFASQLSAKDIPKFTLVKINIKPITVIKADKASNPCNLFFVIMLPPILKNYLGSLIVFLPILIQF
jgi:hypothetical protein